MRAACPPPKLNGRHPIGWTADLTRALHRHQLQLMSEMAIASVWRSAAHFRSAPRNGHWQGALACLKSAKRRQIAFPCSKSSAPQRARASITLKRPAGRIDIGRKPFSFNRRWYSFSVRSRPPGPRSMFKSLIACDLFSSSTNGDSGIMRSTIIRLPSTGRA